MNSESKVVIIAFSQKGHTLARCLQKKIDAEIHPKNIRIMGTQDLKEAGGLQACMVNYFKQDHVVILFICAVGIAVRGISKALNDKLTDPPVIVIDDHGHFVISLLSGHVGGGNALAQSLSDLLKPEYKSQVVITTATDLAGSQGIEPLFTAFKINLQTHRPLIKKYNLNLADGGTIGVYIDPKIRVSDQTRQHFIGQSNQWVFYTSTGQWSAHKGLKLLITLRRPPCFLDEGTTTSYDCAVSQSLVVGTGCKKNLPQALYQKNLTEALRTHDYLSESIHQLVSIQLKKEEKCLLATAEALQVECSFFSIQSLLPYETHFKGSDFVKKTTGIAAVAGPSAYHLTHDTDCYDTLKYQGTTFAFGRILL